MLYITKKTDGVVKNVLHDVNRMRITTFEQNFINYLKNDPIVRIVMFINNNDWCTISQINRALKISKSSLYTYLRILRDENIVRTKKKKGKSGASFAIYSTHITHKYLR